MILLNILFTGRYISDSSNIGHEMINLIKDDEGDNYIYVTPLGKVANADEIEAVLMARFVGNGDAGQYKVPTGICT